ncbi:hypothetical protein Q1M64_05655 (plasmid) [Sinorhizobium meliloti]|nr:hypothetical protein Q1M64_05655 [Sinorhizobium meliloti]
MLFLTTDRHDATNQDEKLERLVLEATIQPTDERALAHNVMAKIAQPKRRALGLPTDFGSWSMPATAATMALAVTVSAVGGYVAGGCGNGDLRQRSFGLCCGRYAFRA